MRSSEKKRSVLRDEDGVYQTEYVIVLILVALAVVVALTALAVPLMEYHDSVLRLIDEPLM